MKTVSIPEIGTARIRLTILTIIDRKAFSSADINLPNSDFKQLESCVWHGPEGFSSKPALYLTYGNELDRLFREILKIPNATSSDALEYLEQLKDDDSTTMTDVAEVYVFIRKHCANTSADYSVLRWVLLTENRFSVDDETACIAVLPSQGSILN